jgi:hypothetical protein
MGGIMRALTIALIGIGVIFGVLLFKWLILASQWLDRATGYLP